MKLELGPLSVELDDDDARVIDAGRQFIEATGHFFEVIDDARTGKRSSDDGLVMCQKCGSMDDVNTVRDVNESSGVTRYRLLCRECVDEWVEEMETEGEDVEVTEHG